MEILLNKPGKKIILLGNEAIVRGALEEGVNFVSTYPGTPASEIGDTFYKIAKKAGVYFEFSTNEKVAMEAAAGASFSGLRSLVAMKNFGLNVASDFLFPLAYTGIRGGMVIFVADDPSCWSSAQSEDDSRYLIKKSHLPLLEPSEPQESKDFTKFAFELSEKFKIPIIIRHTTRASHQSSPVILGKMGENQLKIGNFIKNPHQFITMPPRVLEMKKELLEKIEKMREISEKSPLNYESNRITNNGFGIITSGVSYLYVIEALKELNLKTPILKLGFIHPLPKKKIQNFIKNLKKVLIVEELEPYLEKEVERLAKDINCKLKVIGKGLIPEVGELRPEIVTSAIAKFANCKLKIENSLKIGNWKLKIPQRFPQLCPGCPYWFVVSAVKKALRLGSGQAEKEVIFGGEIGCYMLFGHRVINLQDYLYCMGSDVGIAHGISKASQGKQKVIAFVGDSSFFHAGIPALINTVFNKSNPLIIVLDNQTTAMTGYQPHPGVEGIKIEAICQACGIKNLKVIDPINQKEFTNTVKEFLNKKEVSVIVARRPCIQIKK